MKKIVLLVICLSLAATCGRKAFAQQSLYGLRLQGDNAGNVLTLKAPAGLSSYTLTLPSAVGSSGSLLYASNGTGLTAWTGAGANGDVLIFSGGVPTWLAPGTTGQVLTISLAGAPIWTNAPGTGTVTSVGLSMPAIFTVTNSPVITSGTLTATLTNESANQVFAGPTSGLPAAPTFRSIVPSDFATQTANTILAGPTSGVAAAPTFRSLSAADLSGFDTTSFILNQTTAQPSSNFNISGTGAATTFSGHDATVTGSGSALTVRGGNALTTGSGGGVTITGSNGVGLASAGGAVLLTAGAGGTTGGGGAITLTTGNGAGNFLPGNLSLTAGNGGATGTDIAGGTISLTGGTGSGLVNLGLSNGGAITLTGGTGGAAGGAGGAITITGGTATNTTGGAVTIQTGINSAQGGILTLKASNSTNGAGSPASLSAANASTSGSGGSGGTLTLSGGSGGNLVTGTGGPVLINGGAATTGNNTGGAVTITAGVGVGSGTGGASSLNAGNGTSTGTGGNVSLTAGSGGVAAGTVSITGGASSANTVAGGAVTITGGTGSTTGAGGAVTIGGGLGSGAGATGGPIVFQTAATTSATEAARITNKGYLGIATPTPNVSLDINGGEATRATNVTLTNTGTTPNDSVAVGNSAFERIVGPGSAFTLAGLAAGSNGQRLRLINTTGKDMTIKHLGAHVAANNIETNTGGDVVVKGTVPVLDMIYDSTLSEWLLGTLNANQVIGGVGSLIYAVKSSYQGDTNSTALVNDNDLTFNVSATQTWEVNGELQVDEAGTHKGGIQFTFSVTGNPTIRIFWEAFVNGNGSNSTEGSGVITTNNGTASISFSSGNSTLISIRGIIQTDATAGTQTINFQWAQASADNNPTIIEADSYMKIQRIK